MTQSPPFNRTKCACRDCVACCKRQPGPLIPGDYERIQKHLGAADAQMRSLFWASPGSLVKNILTNRVYRIGTITPRMRKGRCVFLDEDDRCKIHEVAPFGCAYFDTHMSDFTALPRSSWLAEQNKNADYQALRNTLPYATSYKPTRYKNL
jgi:Fe-S-cluster containining protein